MVSLARRNLFHDKVRFGVTLTGIVFAIVLSVVQMGLFIGFTGTTSGVIDHSGADLWIASKGVPFLEVGVPFSERKLYQVLSTPGVVRADKLIIRLGNWKRADGAEQGIIIVGFDTPSASGGPWNIVAGDVRDAAVEDAVFIDRLYAEKLGIEHAGQTAEINGRRARVVGFTTRIRSFTTSPYVFTSFKNAVRYAGIHDDQTIYLLAQVSPATGIAEVRNAVAARVPGVDVYTTGDFSRRTQVYWMFTTGAGVAILIAAVMGLIVGIVVVSQTIYATTMDHVREYGTLKAIGASNRYLYRVLIEQAVWSAALGYAVGIAACYVIVWLARDAAVAVVLPWQLAGAMLLLTVGMCVSATILSVSKVMSIDPGIVFK
jgi:putative ABC transport system permease protein